jgi:hypothetical protein
MKTFSVSLITFFLFSYSCISQNVSHSELLGRPSDDEITLQLFFDEDAEVCVQYGKTTNNYSDQTAFVTVVKNEPANIVIKNLESNTKYFYRVCYRKPGESLFKIRSEHSFHTQRPPGAAFKFIIQADPHLDEQSDTAVYSLCLKNQFEDNPDFMIDLGDILMSDKLKNKSGKITHDTVIWRANLMRTYYEKICHSVPLFIALGNHEGESGWNLNKTSENVAVWGTIERKKYFLNPEPNNFFTGDETEHEFIGKRANYYSWLWGDALFIVLDPYWYTSPKPDSLNGWRWTLGKTQYDWLKSTLENSNAKFKFVFAHQLIGGDPNGRGGVEFANRYEWGGDNLDGTSGFAEKRPGWYKPIKELLTENRVNIFFHGHDHFFGKQEKDCMIYQETPQPSHPNFQNVNYADDYGYFEGQILPNSGHIRVSVDESGVKVEYVRVYLPKNENATRHNKDVAATYFIGATNCYDSVSTGIPVLWNSNYADELIYPNPFVSDTKIELSLLKQEHLYLSVHAENGQLVRKLIDGSLVPAGNFQIIWDGKDGAGNALSPGIYFYSIKGEGKELRTGKIILAR